MNNWITISDFSNPYQVFAESGTASETYLDELITKYQADILRHILGEVEYYNLTQNESDTKWVKFKTGEKYTVDSIVYDYKGIKPVLVKFVYYWWHRSYQSQVAQNGEFVRIGTKLRQVIPAWKMVSAYNDACTEISNSILNYPTVYHFLNDHPTYSFDDLDFGTYEKINAFNL
jgi:hypothetical protein